MNDLKWYPVEYVGGPLDGEVRQMTDYHNSRQRVNGHVYWYDPSSRTMRYGGAA